MSDQPLGVLDPTLRTKSEIETCPPYVIIGTSSGGLIKYTKHTFVLSLITAARAYALTNPAFRSKPVGAPGSEARLRQQDQIAAEDALREAIRKVEAGGSL